MNTRAVASRRFWAWIWGYQREVGDGPYERVNLQHAFVAGFLIGGGHAIRTSAQLIDLLPTLNFFTELLGAELEDRAHNAEADEARIAALPRPNAPEGDSEA